MSMHRLMIVDDSNIIRKKIERETSSLINFDVVTVALNGQDAVQKFQEFRPDVVTMDITMPGMDGIECIQQLVAINPEVNILVVSALSDEYIGLKAMSYGARGFINKPFRTEELLEALHALVSQ